MEHDIVKILMNRDGLTRAEAEDLVAECREALVDGEDDALQTYLDLEDDYLYDVLDF